MVVVDLMIAGISWLCEDTNAGDCFVAVVVLNSIGQAGNCAAWNELAHESMPANGVELAAKMVGAVSSAYAATQIIMRIAIGVTVFVANRQVRQEQVASNLNVRQESEYSLKSLNSFLKRTFVSIRYQKHVKVRFSYLLRLGNFCNGPRNFCDFSLNQTENTFLSLSRSTPSNGFPFRYSRKFKTD